MKVLKILSLLCLTCLMSVSCVSMKKYRESRVQLLRYEEEIGLLKDQTEQLREQNADLEAQVKGLAPAGRIEMTEKERELLEGQPKEVAEVDYDDEDEDEDDEDDDDNDNSNATQAYPSEVEW